MASILTNTLKMMYDLRTTRSKLQSFEMSMDVSRELMRRADIDHKDDGGYVTELAGLPVKVDPGLPKNVVKILFVTPDGVLMSKSVVNIGVEDEGDEPSDN